MVHNWWGEISPAVTLLATASLVRNAQK